MNNKKKYLTEQGIALNNLKLNILNKSISKEIVLSIANAFDEKICKNLLDDNLSLNEFDQYIKTQKKYILTEEEMLKVEKEKIIDLYDKDLMDKGCIKFLLDYNKNFDTIAIKRMIKINVKYFENFFGVTGIKAEDTYKNGFYGSRSLTLEKRLGVFFNTFVEGRLKKIAKEIENEINNGKKSFIKPNSKGIELITSFKQDENRIDISLKFDRKKLKSISGHITKMETFLEICNEVEEKYLQTNLYL